MIGHQIEQESFRIIRVELGAHAFADAELAIVVRVIHATADFDFKHLLRFHPDAIAFGIGALRAGCTVFTDVRMAEAGISRPLLERTGSRTCCLIDDPDVAALAQAAGTTRSEAAVQAMGASLHGGIVAIGNAPTALFALLQLIRETGVRPVLVVGVPVGFVNAAESKAALIAADVPYITAVGRKGGSTVAAACINALLRLSLAAADGTG